MPTPPGPQGQYQHRYTFSSGARPLDGYTIKRAIGRGGFGEVYYALSDAGKEVALKLILNHPEIERRGNELCLNLKCPNLLAIHDLKKSADGDTFVVMEFVTGPSLAHLLAQSPSGLPLPEVRAWLKGIVEGVGYLHDHGIVHRDLKPVNLFWEEGLVKIGDYGLTKLMSPGNGSQHSQSVGTCHYMAPEIGDGKYDEKIDIYAIGIMLYEMLTGHVPFQGETVNEVLKRHLFDQPDLSVLPEPFRTIVGRALAKDPKHRPKHVRELLPREDAPEPLAIRFIGDPRTLPPTPPPVKEDVLVIGPEEPVFYIGPETRPPQDRNRRPQPQPQPQPRLRRVVQFVARRTVAAPPPMPPPLATGRVRLAELATSLLWSTPLTALLLVPATALLDIDPVARPQELAYLGTVALLGAWGVLGLNKGLEGRNIDPLRRRFLGMLVGILVGLVGLALSYWLQAGPMPRWTAQGFDPYFSEWRAWLDRDNEALRTLGYFGVVFLANGWWKLTDRDRKARFRVLPLMAATLIGTLAYPFWMTRHPYGIAVVAVVATVVQLVSPWSAAAASYARYAGKSQITNPNVA